MEKLVKEIQPIDLIGISVISISAMTIIVVKSVKDIPGLSRNFILKPFAFSNRSAGIRSKRTVLLFK